MNYRYMRIIIFFDLPSIKPVERRMYRSFVRSLKKEGFIMMQESVYIKLCLNKVISEIVKKKIKSIIPKNGLVSMLTVTEKQFNSIEMLCGEMKTDIINDDKRIIEL